MNLKKNRILLCISFIIICLFLDYYKQKIEFVNFYKKINTRYEKVETFEKDEAVFETKYIVIFNKKITKKYSIFGIKKLTLPFEIAAIKAVVRKISKISFKNGDKITYIQFADDNFEYDYNTDNELKNAPIGNERERNNALKNALGYYPLSSDERDEIIDFSDSVTIEKSNHIWLKNSNIEHYVKRNKTWKIDYIIITTKDLEYSRQGNTSTTTFLKLGNKKNNEKIKTIYFDDETYEVKEEFFYKNEKLIQWYKYNIFGDIIEVHNM